MATRKKASKAAQRERRAQFDADAVRVSKLRKVEPEPTQADIDAELAAKMLHAAGNLLGCRLIHCSQTESDKGGRGFAVWFEKIG